MWKRKSTFREAFSFVNEIRDLELNGGFEEQLEEFERGGFSI
jgi:hypothetical protein